MKKIIFTYAVMAFLLVSCKETADRNVAGNEPSATNDSPGVQTPLEKGEGAVVVSGDCKEGESLVYESKTFASYTEDKMRGQGVISFTMDINDRLDILNEDDTNFGGIVLNEDMTFFTLTMPKKVVARKVITNYDVAAFDFDAETADTDKNYLFIYVNKQKRKVKKADVKFTFQSWEEYLKGETIKLKDCNLLGAKSKGQAFTITAVNGDEIKIKSTKDCLGEDVPFENVEGSIKWKSAGALIVDFAVCN